MLHLDRSRKEIYKKNGSIRVGKWVQLSFPIRNEPVCSFKASATCRKPCWSISVVSITESFRQR